MKLLRGDCLEVLRTLPDNSVDAIITDPPYGTTDASWDVPFDLDLFWIEAWRLCKPNAPVLVFGIEPFSSKVRLSSKHYRYDWYWNKRKAGNFLFGNKQPLKVIETVSVFYRKQPPYSPIKRPNPKGLERRTEYARGKNSDRAKLLMKNMPAESATGGKSYEADKLLPTCLVEFSKPAKPVHPTQKPVELIQYFLKTYVPQGGTVLDPFMGSGSTGLAAKECGFHFIGIEKEHEYYEIAKARVGASA